MEQSQAVQVLLKASTIWTSQPTDEAIQPEWTEALSRVSFPTALKAVREFRDSGRRDAPAPGEIYREAAGGKPVPVPVQFCLAKRGVGEL